MISINLKSCISIFFISLLVWLLPINLEARMVNEILDNQEEIQLEEENEVDESEGVAETDDQLAVDSPSFIGSFFKLILSLAVVIGLIVLISKFLRKKNGFLKKHQVIENYGGITVGSNKSIQTIKIGERFYVIGVADNIELLMEITDPNTIEQLMKQEETSDSLDKLKAKLTKQPVESTEK